MTLCKMITYPSYDELQSITVVEGKFIQFHWRGVEYLLFATKTEHRFHNQILAHFLSEHGLSYQWVDDETLDIGVDDLTVMGGGRFRYLRDENQLVLWDSSQAYGRFDEKGLDKCIGRSSHPWSKANVAIQP